jgi:hypothetical protein
VKVYKFANLSHRNPVHSLPVIQLFKEILGLSP